MFAEKMSKTKHSRLWVINDNFRISIGRYRNNLKMENDMLYLLYKQEFDENV